MQILILITQKRLLIRDLMQNMPLTTVTIRIGKKKLLEEQKTKLLTLQDKDKGY